MTVQIIVADDSLTARMFTVRCLEVAGVADKTVREATNGQEVLDFLEQQTADLLVLDINMPELDGQEVLKKVKADERFKEIPVVIVSSVSNPEMDKNLKDYGAYAVIKKPVTPAKFVEPIQGLNLVGQEEGTDGW